MVKLIGISAIIIAISFIVVGWGFLIEDFESNYIDGNITQVQPIGREFTSNLNHTARLNASLSPVLEGFRRWGQDEDAGFFELLIDGAIALPIAIISFPVAMIKMTGIAVDQITVISTLLNIPQELLFIGVTGLLIGLTMILVRFARRFDA